MSKLLAKLFIKNYKNLNDAKVRNDYGKLSGIVGIVSNIILSLIKIITGIISFSMALIADGLNNLSDTSSSVVTLIGFKLSAKPADKDHPFGHQRIEYISGLIVSFVILFIGLTFFKTGIEKIINPVEVKPNLITFILLGFSIVIKIWQFFFYRHNGKLISSKTLLATSIDSLNDVITSTAILISLLLNHFLGLSLDGYMTVLVSVIIIIGGIRLIRETISPLIGEAPCSDLVKNVTEDILSYEGVLGIHDLIVHTYGPGKTFITVHVEVDSSVSVITSHNMIDKIEKFINEKYITNLVIHMDPIETQDEYTNEVKREIEKILEKIDPSLQYHDFRVVRGTKNDKVIFDLEYPSNYKISEKEIEDILKKDIELFNPRLRLIIEFDTIFEEGK